MKDSLHTNPLEFERASDEWKIYEFWRVVRITLFLIFCMSPAFLLMGALIWHEIRG